MTVIQTADAVCPSNMTRGLEDLLKGISLKNTMASSLHLVSIRKDLWDWYIYLHEWLIFMVNVGKYTIHGSSGNECTQWLVRMITTSKGSDIKKNQKRQT